MRNMVEPIISVRMNSRLVRVIVVVAEQPENFLRRFSVPQPPRFWSKVNLQGRPAKVPVFRPRLN
jgi:hypothetical protein